MFKSRTALTGHGVRLPANAILFVLTVLLCPAVSATGSSTEPAPNHNTEITLTELEHAWLTQNPILNIVTDSDIAPFGFIDEQGRYVGVLPAIAERIEQLLGIRIQFKPVQYNTLIKLIREGTPDAAALVDTLDVPDNTHYLMTNEVMFMPYGLFVRTDSELARKTPETITDKTIALIDGWDLQNPSLDPLRNNRFVFVDSYLAAVTLVLNGRADAFFDVHASTNYLLARNFIKDIKPVRLYHQGYPAAFFVHRQHPELYSAMQKALAAIPRQERMQLLQKWNVFMDDAAISLAMLDLLPQERDWLRKHPVIRVGIDANWAPMEFVDADGRSQGISIDYLRQFENMLGIRFDMQAEHPWHTYFDMATRGEVDMLSGIVETPRCAAELVFTRPYIEMPVVILTRTDVTYIAGLKELEGRKVAVVRGYALEEWLARDYPALDVVAAESAGDMFGLLHDKQVYACLESLPVAGYYLGKNENGILKVSGQTRYAYHVCMAVRSDYAPLANILQKAFDAIPLEKHAEQQRGWMTVTRETVPDHSLAWKVLLPLLLALALLFCWALLLMREIRSRRGAEAGLRAAQKSLEQINTKLESRVRERTCELENAARTIRDSQKRFSSMAESIQEGLAIVENGEIVYWNRRMPEILGCPPDTLPRFEDLDFFEPESKKRLISMLEQSRAAGKLPSETEFWIRHPDGSRRCIQNRYAVQTGEDGFLNRYVVCSDITERKLAEEALLQERQRLSRIIMTSPIVICSLAPDGTANYINTTAEEVTGYSIEELRGRNWWDTFYPGDLHAQVNHLFEHFRAKDDLTNFEMTLQTKSGQLRTILWNSMSDYDEDGNLRELFGFGNDITERKKAEDEVRQARDYLTNLFKASPDAIIVTDPEGIITMANESVQAIYGYAPEELIGQHSALLFPRTEESIKKNSDTIKKLHATDRVQILEAQRLRKDGSVILVESSIVMLKNPDGTVAAAISSSRDVTDRKKLEEQLRQSQKMESIGTLAGGIAHDFNNILGVIFGYAELSQEAAAGNSILENNLTQILRAADRARNLIRQILAFSRKSTFEAVPIHMHLIINEAISLLRASLPSSIAIQSSVEKTNDIVMADATQMHQVIINLCTNAAHAMREHGGTLDITLKAVILDTDSAAAYSGIKAGSYVKLSIQDTGTGMPPDILERIFEPFFTTKSVGSGTGMGLSVVHGIVKSLKGDIKVYSRPGSGSVFHILLPRVSGTSIEQQDSAAEIPHGHESILLVDDEQMLLDVGMRLLNSLGYTVTALHNPVEALELFTQDPAVFDAVITDQTMPDMTGFELARLVLQIRPDIPVILCTGYSDLVTSRSAREAGIRDFIIKPLDRLTIAQTLRRVLDPPASAPDTTR
jgi:PAS domain S-box-containing protein